MRIGLVSYRCENKNVFFNMSQIERAKFYIIIEGSLRVGKNTGKRMNTIKKELR